MAKRRKIPKSVEVAVFERSGRRCCVCVAIRGDCSEKKGQIAHLDKDPGNNDPCNLCYLCLEHHDEYDSTTSQSKGLTEAEIRRYRERLDEKLPAIIASALAESSSRTKWERYEELFRQLFELRRALNQMVSDFGYSNELRHSDRLLEHFNEFKNIVFIGEPFMDGSVFKPCQRAVKLARNVIDNVGEQEELHERRRGTNITLDEFIATQLIRLDDENDQAYADFEAAYDEVRAAIKTM